MTVDVELGDLGLAEHSVCDLDAAHVARVAATVDAPDTPRPGDALPSLWHWAFFTPTTPTAGLGADGHPVLMAPALAPYPRRMWGAGQVEWDGDLRVGEPAERISTLQSARVTSGGSGDLLIVALAHEYHQGGACRIRERQTIVYRDPPADAVPLPVDAPAPELAPGAWQEERCPTAPLLFRFSAITFNAHRIHYDLPYATGVEGYPGLVVHGPLSSLTLAACVERGAGRRLASWDFRATAPMFAGLRARFVCEPPDAAGSGTAHVVRNDGAVAMQATYGLRAG